MATEKKQVVTPTFRCAFPDLFEPTKVEGSAGEAKYGLVMVFPKTTDLTALRDMAKAAVKEKYPTGKPPPNFRNPFRDGDTETRDDGSPKYPGCIFISARSKFQPGIVNQNCAPLTDQKQVYGGMYCRAFVSCYVYDQAGNKGVAFNLDAVQKVKDGEPFAQGGVNAAKVFTPVEPEPGEETAAAKDADWM